MINYSQKIAAAFLEIEVFKFRPTNPFKWTSGWNSPIYCDNRLILSVPKVRNLVKRGLIDLINSNFKNTEGIAGVATSGIPHAALVSDKLKLPLMYVRSSTKEHGMKNLVEGKTVKGQRVVVVEDLISTGGSALKAVDALRDVGVDVLGVIAIYTYSFAEAEKNFKKSKTKLFTLSNYEALIEEALKIKMVKEEDLESLKAWRDNPAKWNA